MAKGGFYGGFNAGLSGVRQEVSYYLRGKTEAGRLPAVQG
jgi:hypothetical protein